MGKLNINSFFHDVDLIRSKFKKIARFDQTALNIYCYQKYDHDSINISVYRNCASGVATEEAEKYKQIFSDIAIWLKNNGVKTKETDFSCNAGPTFYDETVIYLHIKNKDIFNQEIVEKLLLTFYLAIEKRLTIDPNYKFCYNFDLNEHTNFH
jgi:hypothetical protein